MANIRQIKRRIRTAQNTSKITKAMEMVAASKMRRAQLKALQARDYAQAIQGSLKRVAQSAGAVEHPLLAHPISGKNALLVISTNKGLCGSLNTNLYKATIQWAASQPDPVIIAVGKKAINFTRLAGLPLYAQFTDISEDVKFSDTVAISSLLIERFSQGEFQTVDILFTDFINTLSQRALLNSLLPIFKPGELAADSSLVDAELNLEYTFEPSSAELLSYLLPFYVENTVYQSFLEAEASEHSARMVAMKNASENAGELVDELRLLFNKSRQQAITNELLDITTATLTLGA
jgi:F-type H+-transporting ATPase subunit gamma